MPREPKGIPQAPRNKKQEEMMEEAVTVRESLATWVHCVAYTPPNFIWQAPGARKSGVRVALSCEACGCVLLTSATLPPFLLGENEEKKGPSLPDFQRPSLQTATQRPAAETLISA